MTMATGVLSTESLRRVTAEARVWLIETRPKFLVGSVVMAFLGTSLAWRDGSLNLSYAVLGFIGLLLWQLSVQVLNDYFDYRSGVDLKTQRTPFSGGSGILPAQLLKPEAVLRFGLLSFALAVPMWVYFLSVKGLLLLPILVVGAVFILTYTHILTKWRVGEICCSLGMGILPVLMFYFVQTGGYTAGIVVAAIPSGILLFDIHLLNELPDVEADKMGGRKTLPIILGRANATWLYLAGLVAVYAWVVAWVTVGVMPVGELLSLLTMPLALFALRGVLKYRDGASFTPALWANALFAMLTLALLASGYIIDGL